MKICDETVRAAVDPAGGRNRHRGQLGGRALMQAKLPSTEQVLGWSETVTLAGIHLGVAVGAALALHLGLFAVLPILGHATWHLHRRAVSWNV